MHACTMSWFPNTLVIGQLDQIDGSDGSHESVNIARKIESLEDRFNILQTRIIDELSTNPDITAKIIKSVNAATTVTEERV